MIAWRGVLIWFESLVAVEGEIGEVEEIREDGDEEGETHRSTFENGLCPGVLLLLLLEEAAAALATGTGFAELEFDAGTFRAAGVACVVLALLGDGDGDDEGPKLRPARSRSDRSCLPLEGVAFFAAGEADEADDAAFGPVVTHLCESGCRCVAQNCLLHDWSMIRDEW